MMLIINEGKDILLGENGINDSPIKKTIKTIAQFADLFFFIDYFFTFYDYILNKRRKEIILFAFYLRFLPIFISSFWHMAKKAIYITNCVAHSLPESTTATANN